jgi:hypothetical protein
MATGTKKHTGTRKKNVINKINTQVSRKQRKREHGDKEGVEERQNGGKK